MLQKQRNFNTFFKTFYINIFSGNQDFKQLIHYQILITHIKKHLVPRCQQINIGLTGKNIAALMIHDHQGCPYYSQRKVVLNHSRL